jgi:transposase
MEATGHYWRNLFAFLVAHGFGVALLNPLRTSRFAEEELARTKTDAIDALGIARFAAQKRPAMTPVTEQLVDDLRETVRLREQLVAELSDALRRLHRALDLSFPEFTRHVPWLKGRIATGILARYSTARALAGVSVRKLAGLRYDGRHPVGTDRARCLIQAAKVSVANHHSEPYQLQVRYACENIELLRDRLSEIQRGIKRLLEGHEVGKLLTTIAGIGTQTAACLIGELGDLTRFRDSGALASYVGVAPRVRQSGKRKASSAPGIPLGNARLRRALWMPTIIAIRFNPWLRAYHLRLVGAGKRPKVALVACMRKLLSAVLSVARNRRPFVPFVSDHSAPAASAGATPQLTSS